ncbi:uncharacterized protein [Littorina saxatilis]|uniref:uncharacterized protein n=1 Tax=Littorina saxatilis TaxID=31220 RepID=UPI0038B65448
MFLKAVWLLAGLQIYLVRRCDGLTLSPCGTDNTLEVAENKGDNLFTCSGLTANDTILWNLMAPNTNSPTSLGTCFPYPTNTCRVTVAPLFTPGREGPSTTTMTVNATESRFNFYFEGPSIQCVAIQNNVVRESITCTLDHIAKPTTSACNILVNASAVSSEWTLTANCTVTGVYSYLDRYTCQLVQTSPSVSNQQHVNMTVVSSSNTKYKTGVCDVTVPFPDTSATYSYTMMVTPGRVDVVASFEGSNSFQIST